MLVIRQKGKSQNGGNKKAKHAKFSEKQTFLPPDTPTYVRMLIRGQKIFVFRKIWRALLFCYLPFATARTKGFHIVAN